MLTFHSFTHPGSRPINEDSMAVLERNDRRCFVVADGLGGHGKGDIAAQMLIEAFRREFQEAHGDAEAFLRRAFSAAQDAILAEQRAQHARQEMRTTAVALVLQEGKARWGHVGDSRLYRFRKGKLRERTLDHSVTQALALAGDIKEKQIRCHPDRNTLLRVIGDPEGGLRYELADEVLLSDEDAFLLCTDGFWDFIEEKAMRRALKQSADARQWLEAMKREVEQNGTGADMDNYTAITVMNE